MRPTGAPRRFGAAGESDDAAYDAAVTRVQALARGRATRKAAAAAAASAGSTEGSTAGVLTGVLNAIGSLFRSPQAADEKEAATHSHAHVAMSSSDDAAITRVQAVARGRATRKAAAATTDQTGVASSRKGCSSTSLEGVTAADLKEQVNAAFSAEAMHEWAMQAGGFKQPPKVLQTAFKGGPSLIRRASTSGKLPPQWPPPQGWTAQHDKEEEEKAIEQEKAMAIAEAEEAGRRKAREEAAAAEAEAEKAAKAKRAEEIAAEAAKAKARAEEEERTRVAAAKAKEEADARAAAEAAKAKAAAEAEAVRAKAAATLAEAQAKAAEAATASAAAAAPAATPAHPHPHPHPHPPPHLRQPQRLWRATQPRNPSHLLAWRARAPRAPRGRSLLQQRRHPRRRPQSWSLPLEWRDEPRQAAVPSRERVERRSAPPLRELRWPRRERRHHGRVRAHSQIRCRRYPSPPPPRRRRLPTQPHRRRWGW